MRPLEGHAQIHAGHELAEAQWPVGAGEARVVGAHQRAEHDEGPADRDECREEDRCPKRPHFKEAQSGAALQTWAELDQLGLCAKYQVKRGKAKTFPETPWKGPRPKFIRLEWEVKGPS